MLKQETIHFNFNDKEVTLTLTEASGRVSVKRQILQAQGEAVNQAAMDQGGEREPEIEYMRSVMYPDLISAVVHGEGLDLPKHPGEFAQLMEQLPAEAAILWNNTVYQLNPLWNESKGPEAEKKEPSAEPNSTGG